MVVFRCGLSPWANQAIKQRKSEQRAFLSIAHAVITVTFVLRSAPSPPRKSPGRDSELHEQEPRKVVNVRTPPLPSLDQARPVGPLRISTGGIRSIVATSTRRTNTDPEAPLLKQAHPPTGKARIIWNSRRSMAGVFVPVSGLVTKVCVNRGIWDG